jgi:hypothetical protein
VLCSRDDGCEYRTLDRDLGALPRRRGRQEPMERAEQGNKRSTVVDAVGTPVVRGVTPLASLCRPLIGPCRGAGEDSADIPAGGC